MTHETSQQPKEKIQDGIFAQSDLPTSVNQFNDGERSSAQIVWQNTGDKVRFDEFSDKIGYSQHRAIGYKVEHPDGSFTELSFTNLAVVVSKKLGRTLPPRSVKAFSRQGKDRNYTPPSDVTIGSDMTFLGGLVSGTLRAVNEVILTGEDDYQGETAFNMLNGNTGMSVSRARDLFPNVPFYVRNDQTGYLDRLDSAEHRVDSALRDIGRVMLLDQKNGVFVSDQ